MSAAASKQTTAAARYDTCLRRARHGKLSPEQPLPQPTSAWPAENVALLERYHEWLRSGGASPHEIDSLYIPMAGHVLGLNLKPHAKLDLDADLARAFAYVQAKSQSAEWTSMCRTALAKFRTFLRQQRGAADVDLRPLDLSHYQDGLPAWLVTAIERYQHVKQRNWRPARIEQQIRRFWLGHTRIWRWLLAHAELAGPEDPSTSLRASLRPQHLRDYMDACLVKRHSVSYINNDLRTLHGFLAFLQEEVYAIPQAVFHMPCLPQPETLPRFFTDEQIRQLRDYFERRVAEAQGPVLLRDALLDRATFYLMWQSGLRRGEVEDLLREDLDLPGKRLTVRQGKGRKDRAVYVTPVTVRALEAYLAQRGLGPTDHVFLYRNAPLSKDLIHSRLRAAGETLGFKVFAHRLRHTCATQLLNAGCQVTSIQKLLGHERLNSTMRYARVYNKTAAADYYAAMAQIERRLNLGPVADEPVDTGERLQLLEIAEQLNISDLANDLRLALTAKLLQILARRGLSASDETHTTTPVVV